MAIPASFKRGVVAVLVMLSMCLQGTGSVLAGTTGSISGSVIDSSTKAPVVGVKVTALSPSQSATTTTDANGRFNFLSLAPDTYTISADATPLFDAASISGITVQADQQLTVNVGQTAKIKRIGQTTSRAGSAIVKPGTTADVYSLNTVAQDRAAALGGGTLLNSAWSAISSVPGVYVAPGAIGYLGAGSGVSIRGGDYDQIGYELDGIPVNRSFDNYPSSNLSSLGQQEVQVYTGATPANAEAAGLSGYINQVIKTGTAPAYRNLTFAVGTQALYNKGSFETGGTNPSRLFSYYVGIGTYNQNYRYYDQSNGNGISNTWGTPMGFCGAVAPAFYTKAYVPSCFSPSGQDYTNGGATPAYVLGNYALQSQSRLESRDTVVNLHFGLPTRDGKDDIQVLWDNGHLNNQFYSSTNDQGGAQYLDNIGNGTPFWVDGYSFNQARGALINQPTTAMVSPYYYPMSPTGRGSATIGGATCSAATIGMAASGCIDPNQRDSFQNDQGIIKLQYQKNFGSTAYLRGYVYTYYSDWINYGPQCTVFPFGCGLPSDYELNSHSRGGSLTFGKQLNSQHLLTLQSSYTTASTLRDNNTQMLNGFGGTRAVVGLLVGDPTSGQCYRAPAVGTAAAPVNCYNGSGSGYNGAASKFNYNNVLAGTVPAANTFTCGAAACQWLVVNNGLYATYNTVKPQFTAFSVTDNWKPSDALTVNLGLRYDQFKFLGSDTTNSLARQFLYTAYNAQVVPANPGFLALQNTPSQVNTYSVLQPRLGFTYTVNPTTVLRGSYGRYAQAPNAAFQQYDYLQPNSPSSLKGFANNGIGTTPAHTIVPPTSNNYDFSVEKALPSGLSFKVTPFQRKTQNQIEQFYLDQKTNFVSGVNVGNQTSTGVELEVDKGDFARDGFAGRLSVAYTHTTIRYSRANNGASVVDGINVGIAGYNAFTKAGGGAPCYTTAGAAIATTAGCIAGTVANPYYNAPAQALLDPKAEYAPFDLFPGGIGSSYNTYGAPFVASLITQYKKDRWTIAPAIQMVAGQKYGTPLNLPGVDPSSCGAILAGTPAGDPRYPYGGSGSPYDATACSAPLAIPNPSTGTFDGLAAFTDPTQILGHLQVSYQASKNLSLVGTFANLFLSCFGGTKTSFTVAKACSYTGPAITGGGANPIGNQYNPGNVLQPQASTPYGPILGGQPFNFFLEARIKL